MPAHDRAHYHAGSYRVRSKRVREAANADPETRCWRCGRTLAEERARTGKPVTWHAGHVIDADPFGPLAPEHSTCNTSAGARRPSVSDLNTSRRWY